MVPSNARRASLACRVRDAEAVHALALLVAATLVCTAVFAGGLLSRRTIIGNLAEEPCAASVATTATSPTDTADGTKAPRPPVDQVVLILIDAMRPDFAIPSLRRNGGARQQSRLPSDNHDAAVDDDDAHMHANKGNDRSRRSDGDSSSLTYIEDALRGSGGSGSAGPRPAVGMVLVADAPTTTTQRLKALTAGTIPAFVEAGRNFNSDALEEDNLVWQLRGRATVLGDDTWLALFSDAHWGTHATFPSFDVRDLHTVDEGVLAHLDAALAPADPGSMPRLVVAHFLGVDHAGHRFHARHSEMRSKIAQMDAVLRNVSQTLAARSRPSATAPAPPPRTLLVVLGDHGMTESGDHGGASDDETDTFVLAELFAGPDFVPSPEARRVIAAWSSLRSEQCTHLCRLNSPREAPRLPFRSGLQRRREVLGTFQTDVVPTIAAALGVPIPFSNLGSVMPEVLALVMDPGEAAVNTTSERKKRKQADELRRDEHASSRGKDRQYTDGSNTVDEDDAEDLQERLRSLQECNAAQVRRYAATIGKALPCDPPVDDDKPKKRSKKSTSLPASSDGDAARRLLPLHLWLDRVSAAARRDWTAIAMDRIALGVVGLLFVVVANVCVLLSPVSDADATKHLLGNGEEADVDAVETRPKRSRFNALVTVVLGVCVATVAGGAIPSAIDAIGALLPEDVSPSMATNVIAMAASFWWTGCAAWGPHRALWQTLLRRRTSPKPSSDGGTIAQQPPPRCLPVLCLAVIHFRYGLVFSNSFVVFEADAVFHVLCAFVVLALIGAMRFSSSGSASPPSLPWRRIVRSCVVLLLCARLALWLGQRSRRHGTHVVAATSRLEELLHAGLSDGTEMPSPWSESWEWLVSVAGRRLANGVAGSAEAAAATARTFLEPIPDVLSLVASTLLALAVLPRRSLGRRRIDVLRLFAACVLGVAHAFCVEWNGGLVLHFLMAVALAVLLVVPSTKRRGGMRQRATVVSFAQVVCCLWLGALHPAGRLTLALCVTAISQVANVVVFWISASTKGAVVEIGGGEAVVPFVMSILHLLSWLTFFADGQQCAASTVDWNAAFVGVREYHFATGAVLVFARTFGGFPFVPLCFVAFALNAPQCEDDADNTAVSVADKRWPVVRQVVFGYAYLAAVQIALSSVAIAVLRRHLMLWAVFCPKYIYDVASGLASMGGAGLLVAGLPKP